VRWFEPDISALPVGLIFEGSGISLLLKMIPIGITEKSVLNHLTPRNNHEDGSIQFNRGGSLKIRILIMGY
jgi:hypothetical protein